ncbi:MAG: 30S ribosome-binding factor RbfA [Alphaproteobacteria bacterium]|nr:30S ribosome-binding factor RbfA [Alphaproteobacteria bacterium]
MTRMSRSSSRPSYRCLRVGEVIRTALADILVRGEIIDPDLDGLPITIPEVRMSPDLKIAICYVIPLGGKSRDTVVASLARHASFLRGAISRRVKLRHMPCLRFRFDDSFDTGEYVERLLSSPQVARDLGKMSP